MQSFAVQIVNFVPRGGHAFYVDIAWLDISSSLTSPKAFYIYACAC